MSTKTRLVGLLALLCVFAFVTPAWMSMATAQTREREVAPSESKKQTSAPTPAADTAQEWGTPGQPQGYVRGKSPKKGEQAYNWRQMGAAGIVVLAMAGFVVWLVRKNTLTEE